MNPIADYAGVSYFNDFDFRRFTMWLVYAMLFGFVMGVIACRRPSNGVLEVFTSWWTLNVSRRSDVLAIRQWFELLGIPVQIASDSDAKLLMGSAVAALSTVLVHNRSRVLALP